MATVEITAITTATTKTKTTKAMAITTATDDN
jgi:hypothetical protein